MKKVLITILGMGVAVSAFAKSYMMYEKADENSKEIAKVDNRDAKYKTIFTKNGWIEILDKTKGQVGVLSQTA